MDEIFKALGDPSRRALLDALNRRDGQSLAELCEGLDMARQSVSKHLAVLEEAALITTLRRGRQKLHYLNAVPIHAVADRWLRRYDGARAAALADLKSALEQREEEAGTMTDDKTPQASEDFVYTTYIRTTPERLWQALTEPAFTRRYWGVTFTTDWQEGSEVVWEQFGQPIADPEQVVLESVPGRRLAYTWHTMTREFTEAAGLGEEILRRSEGEPRSRVTFEIEPMGEFVRLTVLHTGFPPNSIIRESVGEGWPHLLSSLKTLLETGEPLPEG